MLLNEMEIFYFAIALKSFSKAAMKLNVSKSYVSKKIAKLERELNTKLVSRSTRQLILTQSGEKFFEYCRKIVNEGKEAYDAMQHLMDLPSGTLKISAPPALGIQILPPILTAYTLKYPQVELDIQLESRLIDFAREGYDVALRAGILESSNLIAQRIHTVKSFICATPNYLTNHGGLNHTNEIEHHNWAIYNRAKEANFLRLMKKGQVSVYPIRGNFKSNQLELIKMMIMNETCVGVLPEYMTIEERRNGKLIQCLPGYELAESMVYVVYPERKFMLPKLKFFLQMLKQQF